MVNKKARERGRPVRPAPAALQSEARIKSISYVKNLLQKPLFRHSKND